ncbi:NUDIX hydrolase [Desulfocurvus sp. DL9XJH121]
MRQQSHKTPSPVQPSVEIVDLQDKPLGVMPLSEAHRQALPHRSVMVLAFDAEGRLYVQKRGLHKALYPGRWDISATGHVRAGESRRDTAARKLEEELRVRASRLDLAAQFPPGPEEGWEFTALFRASGLHQPPSPNPDEVADGMFMDRDELRGLIEKFRERLTPALVGCWERGLIYPLD